MPFRRLAERVSIGPRLQALPFRLRERMARIVSVDDAGYRYVYRCDSLEEYQRARQMLTLEDGTVAWIRSELGRGQVFCDIGANIGTYTLLAARQVGPEGAVFAFEPHGGNAMSLLRNVRANDLADRVTVLSCALHERAGFFEFNYRAWSPGSSLSQLLETRDPFGHDRAPVATELKFATSLDELLETGVVRRPDLVKLDVDGNEALVLRGMRRLLTGDRRPRAVQVEVNPSEEAELVGFMEGCGYSIAERHRSSAARRKIEHGRDPASLGWNGIFRPRDSERG